MSWDVCVGLSEEALDAAASSVYTSLYPRVFRNSDQIEWRGGTVRVDWDVKAAPRFDLTSSTDAVPMIEESLRERAVAESGGERLADVRLEVVAALAASAPNFRLRFANVIVTLTAETSPPPFTLDLTAWCHIETRQMTLVLVADKVTAAEQADPLTDWVVQKLLVPRITTMAREICAGIVIPPIQTPVPLSPPAAAVVGRRLVAVANLAWRGTPQPPSSAEGLPSSKFFATLGRGAMQAFAELTLRAVQQTFNGGDSGGDWWAGWRWNFAVGIGQPSVTLDKTDVVITFSLNGSAWAGVTLLGIETGIGYVAQAGPNPSVRLATSIAGGTLRAVTSDVPPFAVLVIPTGPISILIPREILTLIASGIVSLASLLITQTLRGIEIVSYELPTYTLGLQGVSLRARPKLPLAIKPAADALALEGELEITAS